MDVLEVTVKLKEAYQQFTQVDFTQLFRYILGLQVGDNHQEQRIRANASKVRIIVIADLEVMLQNQYQWLNDLILS